MGFMVSPLPYVLLVGGLEHFEHFPYSYMGCHPKPIDELILFKMVKSTNQVILLFECATNFWSFSKEIRVFSVMNPVIMLKVASTLW